MRKILFIAIFAIASTMSFAQGIEFFKGTFEEAKVKATKENKKIFVDVFTTWCGPCKQMAKKVFPLKEVGDYYNSNFVCMKLDAENQKDHDFFNSFKATSFPSYFWVDANGLLLDTKGGSCSPEAFIKLAVDAVNASKGQQMIDLKKRWDSGEKTAQMVSEYVLGILPVLDPKAIYPSMIEYLNLLTPEQLNSYDTYKLFRGFCSPRGGFFKDDIITKTYIKNIEEYSKYSSKYSEEINDMPMTLYRDFVRMQTGFILQEQDTKVINKTLKSTIKKIKKLEFIYADMYIECIEAEKLIYTKKYSEGIAKMESIILKYGEENPTLRSNFIYTLILGNYLTSEKVDLDRVLKIATDNLRANPSKTTISYYASINQAAGNYDEACSALFWMRYYTGTAGSNAVYSKMNIINVRGKFPESTPEKEAEMLRVKNL